MDNTKTNRVEREKIIIDGLKKLANLEIPIGKTYQYRIETWTKDDVEPTVKGKAGIQITMCW